VIRGKGQTGGKISLRHASDPENLIDSFTGMTSWRWQASQAWEVGLYSIQVQQTHGEDGSEWSEPRTFEVVDARFSIGDAEPMPGQPHVISNEGVILRVQVMSGETGQGVMGVEVVWRQPAVAAPGVTTLSGPDGWADFHFFPDSAGDHTILADLTQANQGGTIIAAFVVTVA
jgi:hypothetical protein